MKNILLIISLLLISKVSAAQLDSTLLISKYGISVALIPHGYKVDSVEILDDDSRRVFLSEIRIIGNKQAKQKILTLTEDATDVDLEIDGLLIDETRSKAGKDFYDYFYKDWNAPYGVHNYMIFISERPYRLNNTLIEIKINETLVFQSFLQRRDEAIEQLAHNASKRVLQYLLQYEEIQKQLGGNDLKGNGIY